MTKVPTGGLTANDPGRANTATAAGLREIAAWLEQNPSVRLRTPRLGFLVPREGAALPNSLVSLFSVTEQEVREFAATHKGFDLVPADEGVSCVRWFGPVSLYAQAYSQKNDTPKAAHHG